MRRGIGNAAGRVVRVARLGVLAGLAGLASACERAPDPTDGAAIAADSPSTAACEPGPIAADFAPRIDAALERAESWAFSTSDEVLADAARLAVHREATSHRAGAAVDPWDPAIDGASELLHATDRLRRLTEDVRRGVTFVADGSALVDASDRIARATLVDHARLVVSQTQLYCTASEATIVSLPGRDPAFDRNLCTTLHPGELVRVLARADAGKWTLVHAGHTAGWVRDGLSAPLAEADRVAWRAAPRIWALRDDVRTAGGAALRLGVGLPIVAQEPGRVTVWSAGEAGPVVDAIALGPNVTVGAAPLRRGSVLDVAFAQMGAPYGWGGRGGHRDCSQFLRDVLVPFGLELPRHSSTQADAGFTTLDVEGWTDEAKLAAIAKAGESGLVLEYMPGHVMLDVGERDGRRISISAIAEYVVPCADGAGETLYRIDRVALTDLETGRDTSRGAFIERITRLAIFGPADGG